MTVMSLPYSNLKANAALPFMQGDVNSDGKITAADARLCLRYASELEVPEANIKAADIFGDGNITAVCARIILMASAELGKIEDVKDAFVPALRNPAALSTQQQEQIKSDWLKLANSETKSASDIELDYFGTYNGCVALMVNDSFTGYADIVTEEKIGGIPFKYSSGNTVRVFKDGAFISLQTAYEKGLLTKENLKNIRYYYNLGREYDSAVISVGNYFITGDELELFMMEAAIDGRKPKAKETAYEIVAYKKAMAALAGKEAELEELKRIKTLEMSGATNAQKEMVVGLCSFLGITEEEVLNILVHSMMRYEIAKMHSLILEDDIFAFLEKKFKTLPDFIIAEAFYAEYMRSSMANLSYNELKADEIQAFTKKVNNIYNKTIEYFDYIDTLGMFKNSGELIEWINTVDIEAAPYKFALWEGFDFKPLVENLRKDNELLIAKYKGQDFSCLGHDEDNYCIIIIPSFGTHGNFTVFYDESDSVSVVIHRIEDSDLTAAKEDYKKYLTGKYNELNLVVDSFGLLQGSSSAYKMIDRYDIIVDINSYSEKTPDFEKIFKDISFEKIKLSTPSVVVEKFIFENYLTPAPLFSQEGDNIYLTAEIIGDRCMLGDICRDGNITAVDARIALRASSELEVIGKYEKESIDVNYDGRITAADARIILRVSAGLEKMALPPE